MVLGQIILTIANSNPAQYQVVPPWREGTKRHDGDQSERSSLCVCKKDIVLLHRRAYPSCATVAREHISLHSFLNISGLKPRFTKNLNINEHNSHPVESSSTIRKQVLERIKPNRQEQERFTRVTKLFLAKLNEQLSSISTTSISTTSIPTASIPATAILGGSGAKGTWLRENHDVDIFVLFPLQKYKPLSDKLSEFLQPALKKAFPGKIERLHGSRDYFQVQFQNISFEIVPILNIGRSAEAVNITDVSPLHSIWVNAHTKKLKDDILLAKQFCRAQRIYGAESYIQGFSGYILEILIACYGSFEKLLEASPRWGIRHVIDVEKLYKGKDPLFELNQSKLQSPLIVIDPVDKSRNAAAALSEEKFFTFKKKAKDYLAKPNADFFAEHFLTPAALKVEAQKRKRNLVVIIAETLPGKEDVVGVRLVKAFEFLREQLREFEVQDAAWQWKPGTMALWYFFTSRRERYPYEIRQGPPLSMSEAVNAFRKKHKDAYVENGRLVVRVGRTSKLQDVVKEIVRQDYVTERIHKVKKVEIA